MRLRCAVVVFALSTLAVSAQENRTELGTISQVASDSAKSSYKNSMLLFPLIALSTETNWVFGFASAYVFKTSKKDPNLRTSTMPAGFLYTLNDQIIIGLGAYIFLPKEKYVFRSENTFSKFPDKFWGIGNDTPNSNEESYTFTQFFINPSLSRQVAKDLFIGGGLDMQNVFKIKYDPGGNFEQDRVVGIYNRTDYFVFGLTAVAFYDSRNFIYVPTRGSLVRIKFTKFNKALWSDYDFHTFDIEARKYVQVKPNKTLAFQAFGLFTFGDVPYRNLAILGGNQMMRGYFGGRYRDKMYITTQAEYRFPIYWRFGGVAFASAGQVADHFSQFDFSRFHYAGGAGIRFSVLPKENLNLRFDVAYGDRFNYYIVLAEAF
ncbi:MAG: BamA/TamA family outer membrane protein [Cytophagales bacterium]|nr:BamA/TamA family outer membrane protein [Cytophagales bacterium]